MAEGLRGITGLWDCVEGDAVSVRGLDGCTFFNGLEGKPEGPQQGDLKADHEVDHIFDLPAAPKHEFAIVDPGLGRERGETRSVVAAQPDQSLRLAQGEQMNLTIL